MNENMSEWRERYARLQGHAENLEKLRVERAKRFAKEGGIPVADPMWQLYLHNWTIRPRGKYKGTPHVSDTLDLQKCHKAKAILATCFDGYRIVERWHQTTGYRLLGYNN